MAEAAPAPVRTVAEVVRNRSEGGANHRLELLVPGFPGFLPGQFAMLSPGALGAAERSDPLLPRPMAVYRARPAQGGARVEVLYKRTGRGTGLLAAARPGEAVAWVGPLGRSFRAPAADETALLVAGGTGIASVYAFAASLAEGGAVRVLLGARGADDVMGAEDFAALQVELEVATEDGSRGRRGLVTDLLAEALDQEPRARVYTCGPNAMMRRCAELAAERGRPCVASLENHMACGFGVCLGCAAPLVGGGFALVCCDGPVMDAARVHWEGLA